MSEIPATSELPEGYRLDLLGDPDAPALRRPDGTVVARFASGGLTHEAIEQEALEDLLGTSRGRGACTHGAHSPGRTDRGSPRRGAHLPGIMRKPG